jgi:hypothetical protein
MVDVNVEHDEIDVMSMLLWLSPRPLSICKVSLNNTLYANAAVMPCAIAMQQNQKNAGR